jgi:[protein-PII] uridylyltransferase
VSQASAELEASLRATENPARRQPDEIIGGLTRAQNPGAVAREYIQTVLADLKERHFAGASGVEIVRDLTHAMDRLLIALFQYADRAHARRFARLNQRLAVVARGGYGREELNPCSDIDLLFLHDWKPGPYLEIVAETILHALWDAGLTVGQVVRGLKSAIRMADEDLKEKTALLDIRFIAGDAALYEDLASAMFREFLNHNQKAFFRAKMMESRERHKNYGDSLYLLEPHIKDGEGGLRDLHTAQWIAKVKYKIKSLEELVQKAVITEAELKEVIEARDFMWRVRNSLHFLSGRHHDQLTFEYQEKIAPILGFKASGNLGADAALMSAYYRHATTISHFAEGLIARATDDLAPGGILRRRPGRRIRPGVLIQGGLLGIADAQFFRRDPLNLLTVYAECQAHGVELSGATYQMVRDNVRLIDERFRADPRVGAELMKILRARERVAQTLESMHRSGVLGAIIPEFGNLYARVLHDLYHIYTVDRHSLVAIRELERLRAGEFKESAPIMTEVAREIDCLPLIFLALLLHDIGKGHGHDHHERGAVLTVEVCRRLALGAEETSMVEFLVRNHLLMSQVAQKGDLEDPRTISDFARTAGSIERLKALYLLTFADMRAVAPKVYNNWRDMLLGDLYLRALKVLEHGDREAVDPERRLAQVKGVIRRNLREREAPESAIDDFLAQMPDRYFLSVPEDDVTLHFDMMRALAERSELRAICRQRHFPEREFSEFLVATRDQPGLFSMIAGVLTANNLNIVSARITTRGDGVVLDAFRVSHGATGGAMVMEEERWSRVQRDLEEVLAGRREVAAMVAEFHRATALRRRFVRRVPTEVTVDNRISEQYTVIDVFTQDRVGLLFEITHTIFKLGLMIHFARVSTNADQALDVFYVSDSVGKKILDQEALQTIRATLTERVSAEPGEGNVR